MRRWIKQLRQKPERTRRRIAFGTSAAITGLISIVWVTVLVQGGGLTQPETETEQQTASPVSALDDNAAAALSSLQNQISGNQNATSTKTKKGSTTPKANGGAGTQAVQSVNPEPYWEANDRKSDDEPDDSSGGEPTAQTSESQGQPDGYWEHKAKEDSETTEDDKQNKNEFRPSADPRGSGEWF